jgi:stearoyl-CoA 9-desaturase NADPH oxidoreductase
MTHPSARTLWARAEAVLCLATTPVAPARYLELVLPPKPLADVRATVVATKDETVDARTLTLRPGGGWRTPKSGQFVAVSAIVDGRIVRRMYSISSPDERNDGCITITVKVAPGGRMSTHLARHSKPGDTLWLGLPAGDFVLPRVLPPDLLFVTAGSGITPVASMVRSLVPAAEMPSVVHLHYAPDAKSAIFASELQSLSQQTARYQYVLLTTQGHLSSSCVSASTLDTLVPDWRSRETWACGPEGLLTSLERAYGDSGRTEHLHTERFRAKRALPVHSVADVRVRFGHTGTEIDSSTVEPLLVAAERAGLAPAHGCRMGICHTCEVPLVSGCVRDLRTGEETSEPGAMVPLCVCAAAGCVTLSL